MFFFFFCIRCSSGMSWVGVGWQNIKIKLFMSDANHSWGWRLFIALSRHYLSPSHRSWWYSLPLRRIEGLWLWDESELLEYVLHFDRPPWHEVKSSTWYPRLPDWLSFLLIYRSLLRLGDTSKAAVFYQPSHTYRNLTRRLRLTDFLSGISNLSKPFTSPLRAFSL